MSNILIVIPARYTSSRLPGKPLYKINGIEMLKRVALLADYVCHSGANRTYVVAADDDRIKDFCCRQNIPVLMTSTTCKNGTERCFEAMKKQDKKPELIINLQGDNPLCPPWVLQALIDEHTHHKADVYTPFVHLNWPEYDSLIESKKKTPFSGTTVLIDKQGYALAFSKHVIPAIRKPEYIRKENAKSPVYRHIGLYAYTYEALQHYSSLEESVYERNEVEGLEQMRFLYNGLKVKMVEVSYRGRETTGGVDSLPDIERTEAILKKYGEFDFIR